MALPTVNVTTTVYDNTGAPVPYAVVTAELDHLEIAATAGYIVPRLLTFVADVNGVATLVLWPNALGGTESKYKIIFRTSKPPYHALGQVTAPIPNNNCNLIDVADAPPYAGQRFGVDGSVWHTGIGLPVPELGQQPDFYLDSATGEFYEKTAVATWTLRGTLGGGGSSAMPLGDPGTVTVPTFFYTETGVSPDKLTEVFVKMPSGASPLMYSDIS